MKTPKPTTPGSTLHKTDKHPKPWRSNATYNQFAGSGFKAKDKLGG
jgi:hypothetical protein